MYQQQIGLCVANPLINVVVAVGAQLLVQVDRCYSHGVLASIAATFRRLNLSLRFTQQRRYGSICQSLGRASPQLFVSPDTVVRSAVAMS